MQRIQLFIKSELKGIFVDKLKYPIAIKKLSSQFCFFVDENRRTVHRELIVGSAVH